MRLSIVVAVALIAGGLSAIAQAQPSMTAAQAAAIARAINLSTGDMPGYTSSPHATDAEARRAQARMFRCAGAVPRSRALADLNSQDFQKAGQGSAEPGLSVVTSHVTVMRSAAVARRDMRAMASARGRACEARYGAPSDPDIKVLDTSLKTLPVPTSGGYGLRFKIHQRLNGKRMTLIADALVFRRGPVEVQLGTLSTAHSFSPAEERRLIALLATRAEQQVP